MWKLCTGAPWRDLPERYGPWQTKPIIPPRKGGHMGQGCASAFDPERYRGRNAIECCVRWLKGYRSVATRHAKLAVHFASMMSSPSCGNTYAHSDPERGSG
jgi:transposase